MPRKSALSKKPNSLRGRPEHIVTMHNRMKIIDFVCAGFKQEEIAAYFNINTDTLRKYYALELDKSKMNRVGKLARNLYLDALAGCKDSRKFYLTCQAGWAPAKPIEKSEEKSPPCLAK